MNPAHASEADLTRLLSHREWLERLAVHLVGDPHVAADLVQDTLLAVLVQRPREGASARAWLRTVLVRGVIRQRKSEACRRARELALERRDTFPSAEEITERTDAHQRVVGAVLALEEPYRSTLLLRFYDGYPPRTIADRTGVPVETVKTRIKRGLAQLRLCLEQDGDRGVHSIALLLAPILWRPLPKLAVAAQVSVACVAGFLLVLGGWGWLHFTGDEVAAIDRERVDANTQAAPNTPIPGTDPEARHAIAERALASETIERAPLATDLHGMAFDVAGQPLAGLHVAVSRPQFQPKSNSSAEYIGLDEFVSIAVSDSEGKFRIPERYRGWMLNALDEDQATILPAVIDSNPNAVNALVSGPAYRLTGMVVDAQGMPVNRAQVIVRLPRTYRSRFSMPMDNSIDTLWHTFTDESGVFEFDDLTYVQDSTLEVSSDQHGQRSIPLRQPVGGSRSIDVELPGLVGTQVAASGVVRDPSGDPIADVCIHYGSDHLHTDAGGRFTIYADASGSANQGAACPPRHLSFVHDEYGPLVLPRPQFSASSSANWGSELELRLTPLGEPVRGVVRGSDGRPVEGVRVELVLPDALLHAGTQYVCAETDLDLLKKSALTDELGRFELPAPADRDVGLLCMHTSDLRWARIDGGVRSGSNVEVPFPAELELERRWLRVVDDIGTAIPNAKVTPHASPLPTDAVAARQDRHAIQLEALLTNEFGLVQLPPLVAFGVTLRVESSASMPLEFPMSLGPTTGVIEVLAPRRAWVSVDLMDQGGAVTSDGCYLRILDANGMVLETYQQTGHRSLSHPIVALDAGRAPIFSVSTDARSIEVMQGPTCINRVSIQPIPGEVLRITKLR